MLSEPKGGATFDHMTDGGHESAICCVVIVNDDGAAVRTQPTHVPCPFGPQVWNMTTHVPHPLGPQEKLALMTRVPHAPHPCSPCSPQEKLALALRLLNLNMDSLSLASSDWSDQIRGCFCWIAAKMRCGA